MNIQLGSPTGSVISINGLPTPSASYPPLDSQINQLVTIDNNRITPATLPHEILLSILKLVHSVTDLKSCILVCKSWCQCGVELLWHKPNFKSISSLLGFLLVISKSSALIALAESMYGPEHFTQAPEQFRTFPYASFVRRLNFSSIADHLDDAILDRLTPCTRLERLTIQGNKSVTDKGVALLLQSCKSLVALDFSECLQLTDVVLQAAAQNCPRLQGINLIGCEQITDEGLVPLAENCNKLRRVGPHSQSNQF